MNVTIRVAIARAKLVAKRSVSRAAAILADALIPLHEAREYIRMWRLLYRVIYIAPSNVLWTVPARLYIGVERVA